MGEKKLNGNKLCPHILCTCGSCRILLKRFGCPEFKFWKLKGGELGRTIENEVIYIGLKGNKFWGIHYYGAANSKCDLSFIFKGLSNIIPFLYYFLIYSNSLCMLRIHMWIVSYRIITDRVKSWYIIVDRVVRPSLSI